MRPIAMFVRLALVLTVVLGAQPMAIPCGPVFCETCGTTPSNCNGMTFCWRICQGSGVTEIGLGSSSTDLVYVSVDSTGSRVVCQERNGCKHCIWPDSFWVDRWGQVSETNVAHVASSFANVP